MSTKVCAYCAGSGLIDGDAETAHSCQNCSGAGIIGRAYLADEEAL